MYEKHFTLPFWRGRAKTQVHDVVYYEANYFI